MDNMSAQSLLSELSRLGVKLGLRGDNQLSVSAPKGRLTEEMLARIREHKAELIDCLSHQSEVSAPQALPAIVPDRENIHMPFPLGDLQTAFLMGDSQDMEYHVRPHYYLETEFIDLDVERYEQALNAVLYRQRANLVIVTDDLRLQTLPEFNSIKLTVQNLRSLPEEEARHILEQTRAHLSRHTLPLDRWPWLECSISLYGEDKVRLHWNNNNFFSDGYGTYKLLEDARRLYENPALILPALSLSYRDCILALAALEESAQGQASKRYWLDRLPTMPGPPPLPLKAGINPRRRSRLERRDTIVPEPVWSAFKRAAKQQGLTPTNALFAVYAEVVACWSGSRHFLFNNMMTHRLPLHPEIKDIIGNFASLYPLEVDWRGSEPFAQRARKLQAQITNDLQHAYWSGVKVLQTLNQVQKTPGRAPCPFVVGSGLFMEPLDQPYFGCLETPQVLLDHQFWELKDGAFWGVWDVIETCFPQGMIDAMWDAYCGLLTRLAHDSDAWSQAGFDLLPASQRTQRSAINRTACALPEGLLHDGLARSAQQFPDRVAVIAPGRSLTFSALYRHANRFAHCLRKAGAQPGERIAVMLDKGWEQVAAVFGILHAGAAYVPIDPAWPQARIHFLLDNVQAKHVVTRAGLCDMLALPPGVQVFCVDDSGLERYSDSPLAPVQQASDLAYIIFTSGSTGIPKGVMIDHRSALNTVIDINRRFGITERDVMFGISALYFDLSVYDLFGATAAGATLVLPSAAESPSPAAWLDSVRQHGVTVWNSVPALMQLLVDAAHAADIALPSLRIVMLSGDWIPVSLPPQIAQVAQSARVISLGGATEASIWSIYYPIEQHDHDWVSVPYGRPLANQSWHILHEDGRHAPTWAPGHLYIGGAGLALGYWQDKEKTDAAFVRHPHTGERLYKTGDLGRYLPDGTIEFLGRADFQVKIQGYRIELGEIEHALLAYPNVHMAAVIVSGNGGGKQLLAFVVPDQAAPAPDSENLLAFLRARLPVYMVPSFIVTLERLPLTSNGKLDRQALANLSQAAQQKQVYTAPRTPIETALVDIWQQVLVLQPVSIHDDFFELGGQSFAAVKMMTRIAKQYGQRLPLSVLLEGRTVAHLAERLQQTTAWSPLVPIHLVDGVTRPCFFIHPAGGNVLCYRHLAKGLGRRFYGLQAAGLSGEQAPLERIEQMAALYLQAIRQVQPDGPYLLGGWSSGGVIAFAIAQQLERDGETVERVLMLDTPAPLQHDTIDDIVMLKWFLEDIDIGLEPSRIDLRELADIGPSRQLTAALVLLAQQQMSVELEPRQLDLIYAVFRSIIHACRCYRPDPIRAPISVLRAREGRVSEFIGHPADHAPDWGWSSFTHGQVASAIIAGNHYTILSPQHGEALLAELKLHVTIQPPMK